MTSTSCKNELRDYKMLTINTANILQTCYECKICDKYVIYDLKDYELTLSFKQIQFTFNNPNLINIR